jgi:hypothetical protein
VAVGGGKTKIQQIRHRHPMTFLGRFGLKQKKQKQKQQVVRKKKSGRICHKRKIVKTRPKETPTPHGTLSCYTPPHLLCHFSTARPSWPFLPAIL